MKKLSDISPGKIFEFAGERFVILLQGDGATLVLLAQSKETMPFNNREDDEKLSDYTRSELKEYIDKWVEKLPRTPEEAASILPFEVDLSNLDRGMTYGNIIVKAAPLTLWQYRQFEDIIPKIKNDWWLVTPAVSTRRPVTKNTNPDVFCILWRVKNNGEKSIGFAYLPCGVRPALLLSSDIRVCD